MRKKLVFGISFALFSFVWIFLLWNHFSQGTTMNDVVSYIKADPNLPPRVEAQALGKQLKDVSYKFEVGMNYQQFTSEYQNLYVNIRRFDDKYPNCLFKEELEQLITCYDDIDNVWQYKINQLDIRDDEEPFISLQKKYPDLKNCKSFKSSVTELNKQTGKLEKPTSRFFEENDVLRVLIKQSAQTTGRINQHINAIYK